jgi:hypothetical protein
MSDRQDAVLALVREGNYLSTAAAHEGVSDKTLAEWMKGNFRARVEAAEAEFEAEALAVIEEAAKTDPEAAAWLRKRRRQAARVAALERRVAALKRKLDGSGRK